MTEAVIAVAAALLLLAALPFALVVIAGGKAFGARFDNYRPDYVYLPEEFPLCEAEDWDVSGDRGQRVHVRAYTNRQSGTEKGTIFWSSGIGGDHSPYLPMLYDLASKGYRVVAYDPTGTGRSGGKRVGGLPQNLLDGRAVLADLKRRGTPEPLYLAGHSNGGYAALALLNFDPGAKAAAVFAAFNDTNDMVMFHVRQYARCFAALARPYVRLYFGIKFGKAIDFTASDGIAREQIPILFIQSRDDDVVPFTEFQRFQKLPQNSRSEFLALDGREHEAMYPPEVWAQMRPLKRRIDRTRNAAERTELSIRYFALGRAFDALLPDRIDEFFSSL